MTLNDLLEKEQYSLSSAVKQPVLISLLSSLNQHHLQESAEYKKIVETIFGLKTEFNQLDELPFIPVSAFKNHQIKSIHESEVFKVLISSGTTGQ
jgi:translation elongation factor EF-1alpha